jgi:CheY-like chemotaxis protein
MKKFKILWTDDEIEVLKPHILFLKEKGYDVDTCSNGTDTVDLVKQNIYDIILLDEHMPGLSGIATLRLIKEARPEIPVVMITKSEEEEIMEAAIGSEIADYLIKPVKPNQILLVLKKNLDQKRLITEKTTIDYRLEFRNISSLINTARSHSDWIEIYKKIVYWDIELEKSADSNMGEILQMQENEANNAFSKFITNNYITWLSGPRTDRPLISPDFFSEKIFPKIEKNKPLFYFLIDNMRYDQWKIIASELSGFFRPVEEDLYFSILPTATQFSRNAIFSGLMPSDIAQKLPQYWVPDDEDEGKNIFEEDLFRFQLSRKGMNLKWSYNKINNNQDTRKLKEKMKGLLENDLNILVINFVDILSHARTSVGVIRDLANDEKAYRSLTRSWFVHSSLFEFLKLLSSKNIRVVFSTDHGTIKVQNPVKIIGDKNTSPNLRYKMGRNLDYDPSKVFEIKNPEKAMLPKSNISSRYIFACNKDFLIYPNNFNHYSGYFKDTFQHGGISMQEMILPFIVMEPQS